MNYWGIKSYENDQADEALDRAFESVHGGVYDDLMDDGNPMTVEQVQARLANPETLAQAIAFHAEEAGPNVDEWDEVDRLGFAGIIVRHAELGLTIPEPWRTRAVSMLQEESIDWDETTLRQLRRGREIELLGGTK